MHQIRSIASALAFIPLAAAAVAAQQPDRATFYLVVGTDTIVVDDAHARARSVETRPPARRGLLREALARTDDFGVVLILILFQ